MVQERRKTPLSVQNWHFGSWTSCRTENHLGSTAAVINDKGELIETTMYTAYGEQIPLMVLPGTEAAAREKFTGKEFDKDGPITTTIIPAKFKTVNLDIAFNNYQLDDVVEGFATHVTGAKLILKGTLDGGNTPVQYELPLTFEETGEDVIDYQIITHTKLTLYNREIELPSAAQLTEVVVEINNSAPTGSNFDRINKVLTGTIFHLAANEYMTLAANAINPGVANYSATKIVPQPQTVVSEGMALDYFGRRYYDPEIALWTSTDPYEQDWSVYAYCGGNPVYYVDPDGNLYGLWNATGFIIGAAIGGTAAGIAAYNASDGDWGVALGASVVGSVWGGATGSSIGSGISSLAAKGFFETVGGSIQYTGNVFQRIDAWSAMKALQMSSTVARGLIHELAINQTNKISVQIDRTAQTNTYSPSDKSVVYNPQLTTYYRQGQVTPKLPWQDHREKVGLYHELSHSYRDVQGKIPANVANDWNARLKEELQNVGVGIFKETEPYSENLFRESIGEPLRDRYLVP